MIDSIRLIIKIIEDSIYTPIDVDLVAEKAAISRFHLMRLWKSITGFGVAEYIRKRKLACCLTDLLHTTNTAEFISSKYHLGTERSFNRMFKNEFGITPKQWRKNPQQLSVVDAFNETLFLCIRGGVCFPTEQVVLPEIQLFGTEFKIESDNPNKSILLSNNAQDFFNTFQFNNAQYGYQDVTNNSQSKYFTGININQDTKITPQMISKRIPSHLFACFTYVGGHSLEDFSSDILKDMWKYIDSTWKDTTARFVESDFLLEIIDKSECNNDFMVYRLYFPIKKV